MVHSRTLQRGLSASAVVLLLVAQLGALLHHVAIRHVRCEHGELVEAAVLAKHLSGDSRVVAVDGAESAGDEHCAVADGLRSDPRSDAPALAVTPVAVTAVTELVPLDPPVRHALYRTAPKTSPPA